MDPEEDVAVTSVEPVVFRDPGSASTDALSLARALGLSITAADVLHRAGFQSDDTTKRFLDPRLSHLTPPDNMADRDLCAQRIADAVRRNERITVFGDYDCDGITATAIVTSILRALGGTVVALLATRQEGSYGLSEPALQRVLATGPTLVITCDCGSSDHPRLAELRRRGIDVIVIDHHLVPDEPLPALGFLNPHRPECGFKFKGLASCGLALSLGAAVRTALGKELDLRHFLDLVAIGTIADVAPLIGDNRALVRSGLRVLGAGTRPGLRALAGLAKLDLSQNLTSEDVSFRIAPRLNAPGRLADPDLSLQLLLEPSHVSAAALAASIEQLSMRRREMQDRMIEEALSEIKQCGFDRHPALVLAREGWHPGIVGIVAGRLATMFNCPTIVVGLEGKSGRGSVRGPTGARLYDALGHCREALEGFGGHQAAAGVHVAEDKVSTLRDAWCAHWEANRHELSASHEEASVRLDDRDDPAAVVRDLERLEPFGEANRAPRMLLQAATVQRVKNVKGHLKLDLSLRGHPLSAFGFQLGETSLSVGETIDLVGYLRRDTWKGGAAVEMRVERIAPARD